MHRLFTVTRVLNCFVGRHSKDDVFFGRSVLLVFVLLCYVGTFILEHYLLQTVLLDGGFSIPCLCRQFLLLLLFFSKLIWFLLVSAGLV